MVSSIRSRRRGGFTLLELLVSLVVIALLSAWAIDAFFSRGEITLRNATTLLAMDLRAAQARASLVHHPVEVRFDPDGGGYRARLVGEHVADGAEGRRYDQDAVFEGVRVQRVHFQRGRSLVFDRWGKPSTNATVTLRYGDAAWSVLVHERDGRVVAE